MRSLLKVALILVIALMSLSAYLRLSHSGIGCAQWPACYGRIGEPPQVSQPLSGENVYQRIVAEASQPLAWATPLHRLVASVLGLLIAAMTILAFWHKRLRLMTLSLLLLTIFLAVLGVKSGSLHSPAVVMGNLAGGFLMLGLLAWMLFTYKRPAHGGAKGPLLRRLTMVGATLLVVQVLLGGLTSANFAATACPTLPDCNGAYLPGVEVFKALNLNRTLQVSADGQAIGGAERVAIHQAHRLLAVLTALAILMVGWVAWREAGRYHRVGAAVFALVAAEFVIGVAAILGNLPIGLAVAHNWLAALLLLGLLKIAALNKGFV